MKDRATFRIWRTQPGGGGGFRDYTTAVSDGMVVLDAVHHIQAEQAPDLAVRWNCKAGKCGSCSAEVNGRPRLMCMTRLSQMNLIDTADRIPDVKEKAGIGYCNITKCCTNVCPENIHITDNGIIPLKERVVSRFYDPVTRLLHMLK